MYAPDITARHLHQIERQTRIKFHRYRVSESLERASAIQALVGKDRKLKRSLTAEERAFTRNECLLSKFDFMYGAQRYLYMEYDGTEGGGVGPLRIWPTQSLVLDQLKKLETAAFDATEKGFPSDGICLAINKNRQLGMCLGAGTRLLKADLSLVPIENIRVGDELVAVDEYTDTTKLVRGRKMRKATVTGTHTMYAPTYRIVLEDGTTFTATPHHRFLCRSRRGDTHMWRRVDEMRVGDGIRKLHHTWGEPTYEDGWFGGFLDGEGSITVRRPGAELNVAQLPGATLERARKYLQDRNFIVRVDVDKRKAENSSKFGSKPVYKLCISRMADVINILGRTGATRYKDKFWYEDKCLPSITQGKRGDNYGRIVSITESIQMPVYDIETTTGTYIAEGYISHNTALWVILGAHRQLFWAHTRGFRASIDDSKVHELYKRDKIVYDNLPWFMRPSTQYDVKDSYVSYEGLHSTMSYQKASQESGLGTGQQYDFGHLTEVSQWSNPERIRLDFFDTLPLSPYTLAVLESVPLGRGNWWHDFTEEVRRGEHRRWHWIFVPSYILVKKYSAVPPAGWNPSAHTVAHAQLVADTSPSIVGYKVELTREQQFWFETERLSAQKSGELNLFLTNHSPTPEQSFQFSGQSAFDVELMDTLRVRARKGMPYTFERFEDPARTARLARLQ